MPTGEDSAAAANSGKEEEEDGGEGRRRGTMESGGEGVDGEGARERERGMGEKRDEWRRG